MASGEDDTLEEEQREAESTVSRLMLGKKEKRRVTWTDATGEQKELQMQVLSLAELQLCYSDANKRFSNLKLPVDSFGPLFGNEVILQILWASCREIDGSRIARSIDELRSCITDEDRADLFLLYNEFKEKLDPTPASLTEAQHLDIFDAIKKKDGNLLRRFGPFLLASYLLFTDSQPSTSSTGN